jgi:hypothetical protein
MIIRFENHVFFNHWGQHMSDRFQQHFRFDPNSPWQKHQWRPNPNTPWRDFHGKQDGEWAVFDFARTLDDRAAKLSISMGLPQIMGFNFATIGYASAQEMFEAFSTSERAQLLGFFDFVCGPSANPQRQIALQEGNFEAFATRYNGPGQAAKYGSLLREAFTAFQALHPL